jgi:hypothetical protein
MKYKDEDTLNQELVLLMGHRFDTKGDIFDIKKLLNNILNYHDIKQVLKTTNIKSLIEETISSESDPSKLSNNISNLNKKVEGLRAINDIAVKIGKNRVEKINEIAYENFLEEPEISQLKELVTLYANGLEKSKHPIEIVEINSETVLRCLTEEIIIIYLNKLHASRQWLKPIETFFKVETINEMSEDDDLEAILPGNLIGHLLDEEKYICAIDYFEGFHQPLLADVARIFLTFSRAIKPNAMNNIDIKKEAKETTELLDRIDKHGSEIASIFGEFRDLIFLIEGQLCLMIGIHPALSLTERAGFLERSESHLQMTSYIIFKLLIPIIRWNKAQLYQDTQKNRLELDAIECVNGLIAESTLMDDPVMRTSIMTLLVKYLTHWKYIKGDYKGSIESAMMGKSISIANVNVIFEMINPLMDDILHETTVQDTFEEENPMNKVFCMMKNFSENLDDLSLSFDLSILMSRARLAEIDDDFENAYFFYQEAARIEKRILDGLRSVLSTFFENFTGLIPIDQGFQYEARALYFQGKSFLNLGDKFILSCNYAESNQNYLIAKKYFAESNDLWYQEMERQMEKPLSQYNENIENSRNEQYSCTILIRYCDAKIEISDAEKLSYFRDFWSASKRFEKASGIFEELLNDIFFKDDTQSIELFKASRDFCKGRWLLEMDRDSRKQDNKKEGIDHLKSASIHFGRCGAEKWALYMKALCYEYEAIMSLELLQDDESSNIIDYSYGLIQDQVNEAKQIFKQIKMEERALYLDDWVRTASTNQRYRSSPMAMPKPRDEFLIPKKTIEDMVGMYNQLGSTIQKVSRMQDELIKLQARSIALGKRLSEIKDRRDNGRLDEGRYVDLANSLDSERIEILLNLQKILKGKNENLDNITADAIRGDESEEKLLDKLAEVAKKEGLSNTIIDGLKTHKDSIISGLIQIGIELGKVWV